jgi:hypothetical protein
VVTLNLRPIKSISPRKPDYACDHLSGICVAESPAAAVFELIDLQSGGIVISGQDGLSKGRWDILAQVEWLDEDRKSAQ